MKFGDTSYLAENIQLKIFKAMGPEKRLERAIELSNLSLKFLREGVSIRHPEYNEEQIKLAVIKLLLPEKLFKLAYSDKEEVKP